MSFDTRKSLLAKVHIAKAQLQLTDDAYRAVLARHGVESSKELDTKGLEKLLDHFAKLGWQAKAARTRKGDKHGAPANLGRGLGKGNAKPYDRSALMTKIEALLAEKGTEQGKHVPWDYAKAILKRMYKLDRLEWATPEQLRGVMVALMQGGRRKRRIMPPVPEEANHAAP
ncbi:MAG: regulatory protein GemA [Deltaproteobacteria bacterium HGW-Deltaproteobacteria-8]|jgi:phage gp16-like protein|nr:MAG: regulatory protein GemA [Deltaproteobacteria bacterium HGW-Deltaproteobacteria-8]